MMQRLLRGSGTIHWSVYLIPFLTDVSAMLLIFAVGRSLAEQGASLGMLGLIGGGHALAAAISSLICGPLSDRVGRERLIIPGMLVFLVAAAVSIAVPTGQAVSLLMYWMSALALGMIHPPTIAWINSGEPSSRSARSRGMSGNLVRFCIAWNLGVLVAQLGGGELFLVDPSMPFLVSAGVMVLNLSVALFVAGRLGRRKSGLPHNLPLLDRTLVPPLASAALSSSANSTAESDAQSHLFIRLAWLANLGGAVAVSMMLHLFPRLAVGLEIPANEHGAILASMRVIAIVVYLVLHRTDFWHYRFSVSVAVQLIAFAGLLCVYFASTTPFLVLGVCGVALLLGYNYFAGIYYGSAGHEEDRRGFASGMHEATLGAGVAIGSAGGGVLGMLLGERMPYLLAALVVAALLAVQVIKFEKSKAAYHPG